MRETWNRQFNKNIGHRPACHSVQTAPVPRLSISKSHTWWSAGSQKPTMPKSGARAGPNRLALAAAERYEVSQLGTKEKSQASIHRMIMVKSCAFRTGKAETAG